MDPSSYLPPHDGADLYLTLDRNIQSRAEAILEAGISQTHATSGNIVVLDPHTGGILAMANRPTYRPAFYGEDVDNYGLGILPNTSISSIYEPGSVFKPLTLAAALEERVIDLSFTYDDTGQFDVGPGLRPIQNWDRQAHGRTSLTQLLAYSLNVGAATVAQKLGPTRFYEAMRRFGLGEVSGVDLALESPGVMRMPGDRTWSLSDLATNSYGQGLSATALQVASAYAALANGGVLIKPHVVAELHQGGKVTQIAPEAVRRVISTETAQQITQLMVDAVELGLKSVVVPGYRLAGKSGTAGIPDISGYEGRDVVASFVGYGPVPDPRFVILVKYDKPQEGYWGGEVAAPAFREMAKFLIDYYGLPPAR
jgi:cell division protein FtsI/penicillin-binding protein 2